MNPAISSLDNIRRSIELYWYETLAITYSDLLISKTDYTIRLPELYAKKYAFVWDVYDAIREAGGHRTITLQIGATSIEDPGDTKLMQMLDRAKFILDSTMRIPVYEYINGNKTDSVINTILLNGATKWPPTFTEPNSYRTSVLITTARYIQEEFDYL